MNSRSEPLIWQTWSEKRGSWENWFQARVPHDIPEGSMGILSVRISTQTKRRLLNSRGPTRTV
jgi:hypothetical protein